MHGEKTHGVIFVQKPNKIQFINKKCYITMFPCRPWHAMVGSCSLESDIIFSQTGHSPQPLGPFSAFLLLPPDQLLAAPNTSTLLSLVICSALLTQIFESSCGNKHLIITVNLSNIYSRIIFLLCVLHSLFGINSSLSCMLYPASTPMAMSVSWYTACQSDSYLNLKLR